MLIIEKLKSIYLSLTQNPDINVVTLLIKTGYYHLQGRKIFADHTTTIKHVDHILTNGELHIGRHYEGFFTRRDRTFLNIEGRLIVNGLVSIGRGCCIYTQPDSVCIFNDCQVTGKTSFIISHSMIIGKHSIISWGCQFLDSDWHRIEYEGKREKENGILIGEHVWIGNNVTILKGVHIGNNCVIGAGAVVTGIYPDNVLIAGNPAKIVKQDIQWL
jgi:acetyltransferase-like isoleucine patch superfamily enzyme